jgi:radical SAM superfamily enzyme YgiQ (UPF0313 family)
MNIELIHPPHPSSIEDRLDAPLGLLYIAANLKENGYDVIINDLSGIPKKKWNIGSADLYGITVYAPTVGISEEIAKKCKEINYNAKIAVGGAHPTAVPKSMNKTLFDMVIIGEGEEAFLRAVKDYPNNERFYKKPLKKDLDIYPNPAYHLVDLFSYKRKLKNKPAVTVLASRGCPFRCNFCGLPEHHKTIKKRSPEKVRDEIKYIKERWGIKNFIFQDDVFTTDKKRLYNLLNLLKPLNINFKVHGRAGIDTKEKYLRLKDAGCTTIAWGIESGSQKMLDLMNKKSTVNQNYQVIQWAKEVGLVSRAFFVLGFPGETKETILETKKFIEKADPNQFFVSNFVPYPDTDVWNKPKKYGITSIRKDFSKYYQVDETGFGSMNIETKWLKHEEFKKLEKDFREWIIKRGIKGSRQEYEDKIYN